MDKCHTVIGQFMIMLVLQKDTYSSTAWKTEKVSE